MVSRWTPLSGEHSSSTLLSEGSRYHLSDRPFICPSVVVGRSVGWLVGRSVGRSVGRWVPRHEEEAAVDQSEMQLVTARIALALRPSARAAGERQSAREGRGTGGSPGALSTDFSHPASQLRSRR